MPELQTASILIRSHDYIIQPESRTSTGLWIVDEPIQVIECDAPTVVVGKAVRLALNGSRDGVDSPKDWRTLLAPLLKVAGVRSWDALQRSSRLCEVEATCEVIRVMPSQNGGAVGPNKGFHTLREKAITLIPNSTDEEIGDAVRRASELCC